MKEPFRVLICGDRSWDDMRAVEGCIIVLKEWAREHDLALLIIAGGAPGADTMARLAAHKHDVHCAEVMALWATRHRSAGPQRNEAMLSLQPNKVIAFHHDISKSRGTKHMVSIAKKAGVPVEVYD